MTSVAPGGVMTCHELMLPFKLMSLSPMVSPVTTLLTNLSVVTPPTSCPLNAKMSLVPPREVSATGIARAVDLPSSRNFGEISQKTRYYTS